MNKKINILNKDQYFNKNQIFCKLKINILNKEHHIKET